MALRLALEARGPVRLTGSIWEAYGEQGWCRSKVWACLLRGQLLLPSAFLIEKLELKVTWWIRVNVKPLMGLRDVMWLCVEILVHPSQTSRRAPLPQGCEMCVYYIMHTTGSQEAVCQDLCMTEMQKRQQKHKLNKLLINLNKASEVWPASWHHHFPLAELTKIQPSFVRRHLWQTQNLFIIHMSCKRTVKSINVESSTTRLL